MVFYNAIMQVRCTIAEPSKMQSGSQEAYGPYVRAEEWMFADLHQALQAISSQDDIWLTEIALSELSCRGWVKFLGSETQRLDVFLAQARVVEDHCEHLVGACQKSRMGSHGRVRSMEAQCQCVMLLICHAVDLTGVVCWMQEACAVSD